MKLGTAVDSRVDCEGGEELRPGDRGWNHWLKAVIVPEKVDHILPRQEKFNHILPLGRERKVNHGRVLEEGDGKDK